MNLFLCANISTGGKGCPSTLDLNKAEGTVKKRLRHGTSDSSAFRLQDMKKFCTDKKKQKAKSDGLGHNSVDSSVCDRTEKTAMFAMAISVDAELALSNKKLLKKTGERHEQVAWHFTKG